MGTTGPSAVVSAPSLPSPKEILMERPRFLPCIPQVMGDPCIPCATGPRWSLADAGAHPAPLPLFIPQFWIQLLLCIVFSHWSWWGETRMSPPHTEHSPKAVGQDRLLEEGEARATISHPCCHPSSLARDTGKGPCGRRAGLLQGPSTGTLLTSLAKRSPHLRSLHLTALLLLLYVLCVVSCRVPAGSW